MLFIKNDAIPLGFWYRTMELKVRKAMLSTGKTNE